jgi:prepilin-type N-terminal cleavage/methylation domain-containing protein
MLPSSLFKQQKPAQMNNALNTIRNQGAGFTLVEIMIVVAILALLAAIATPNYQRARKRGQAARILNDLRVIDYALDRWAIENNKIGTDTATVVDLRTYLKAGTALYETGLDVLGNPFGPNLVVDEGPKVPSATWEALSDVVPASYWSPYK